MIQKHGKNSGGRFWKMSKNCLKRPLQPPRMVISWSLNIPKILGNSPGKSPKKSEKCRKKLPQNDPLPLSPEPDFKWITSRGSALRGQKMILKALRAGGPPSGGKKSQKWHLLFQGSNFPDFKGITSRGQPSGGKTNLKNDTWNSPGGFSRVPERTL